MLKPKPLTNQRLYIEASVSVRYFGQGETIMSTTNLPVYYS